MKNKANVVIIGGGIIGCSIGYYLAKYGVEDIVIIEKEYPAAGSTGRCGAGVRHQWGLEMNCLLAKDSIKEFERLHEEIPTEFDIQFKQKGYLMLAYSEKVVEQYKKNIALQRSLGIDVQLLSPQEAKEIVPHLNTDGLLAATYCPKDGHINPFLANLVYAIGAERLGVQIYKYTEVVDVEVINGRVTSVITTKGKIKTNYLINAAGPYAQFIAKMVGIELPVYSERHQILVTQPVKQIQDPMVISLEYGFYCQQVPHGSFIMGFGDPNELKGTDISSTANFLEEMAEKIIPVLPVLKNIKVLRQWAGLYNMTPDAQPILGNTEEVENFYLANGFSGHGFMIAPAVGKLTAKMITDQPLDIDIKVLNLKRFKEGKLIREPSVV
ncbi:NAD(P)/FAD-dependent oxidoreductase [Anaerobranca gottschalkii]|uniref:Sarcosine oxidase subunit beta n=1 Tax=Anaerobranca gottschalkii DSM 13577 TaxID=1120990 RepID=A0A1H9Y8N3_9FIRM|nr:FAD-binding oxidoreductase [Anaerobranca gottschalkii]SES65174.1 sarcosine oxidase subunit beta [Anaerobranca gottschalkii DSM 13577]